MKVFGPAFWCCVYCHIGKGCNCLWYGRGPLQIHNMETLAGTEQWRGGMILPVGQVCWKNAIHKCEQGNVAKVDFVRSVLQNTGG